jgi:hypothetical protein
MKILKFAGVFLVVIIIMALIIYLPNKQAFKTILSNSSDLQEGSSWIQRATSDKGLVNYMKAMPNHVALVSFTENQPDSGIYFQADNKRVMGSTANLLLIIEYARQVNDGILNPEKPIKISTIDRYNLPKYYSSNHSEAVSDLKKNHQISNLGTIPVKDLIKMMVRSNDLAASDCLYFILGSDNVTNIPKKLNTKNIDPPLPWSGQVILWKATLYNQKPVERLHYLQKLSGRKYRQLTLHNTIKLASNVKYREKVYNAFSKNGLGLLFSYEKNAYQLTPKATPRAMAQLLYRINEDSLFNPDVSKIIKKSLQWSFDTPSLKKQINYYGGIFDSRMGILNGIDIGNLKKAGSTRMQVLYLNNVPVSLWMHLSSEFTNQTMQRELIWKPEFYHYTYRTLME